MSLCGGGLKAKPRQKLLFVHRQDRPVGFAGWLIVGWRQLATLRCNRPLVECNCASYLSGTGCSVRNAEILRHGLQSVPAVRIRSCRRFRNMLGKILFLVNPIQLRSDWDRDRLAAINAEGIPRFTGICPELYLEQAVINSTGRYPRLAAARKLGDDSIMLLSHPTWNQT